MSRNAVRRASPRRCGFTLVELLLVTMLLAIMAGVAAPRYQAAMDDSALRAAAKRLAADLRHARQQARTRAESVAIDFSVAAASYQADEADQDALTNLDRAEQGLMVVLDARVAMTSADFNGQPRVEFDFRGDPVQSGSVVLSNRSQTITVSVNALGAIEVTR